MSSAMRAIEIAAPGPADGLRLTERPRPTLAPGEVLVRVAAAGVNRPDVFQRLGRYTPPPGVTDIPGLEIAGHIVDLLPGPRPSLVRWHRGDQVCALVAGGGYADYCAVPVEQCMSVPEGLTLVEAAAVPETFCTVWSNLFDRAGLREGESLLVHGGASGIGTTAIQMARAFGVRVFTTAGTDAKCAACVELGAELAVNYRDGDWAAEMRRATNGRGVDVILDMVGGDYVAPNLDLLADDGRLVQIAFLKASKVELDLMPVMRRRLTITGSTLRPRSLADKAAIARALEAKVWPLLASRAIHPVIDTVLPLARAADAHRLMESSEHIGKIVLDLTL